MISNKQCPRCGVTKPVSDFGSNRASSDGLSCYCLECKREVSNAQYRKRREAEGFVVRERIHLPEGLKRCARCHEIKPVTEFHVLKRQSGGRNPYCKECRRPMGAESHIKRTYGLTRAEVDALVDTQGGRCAICETNPAVHVDHDHATGKIRGVLCFTCNVALGQLKDDVTLFRKAIDYLEGTA